MKGFGLSFSISISFEAFVIYTKNLIDPFDYTRSFQFNAFTVWGVTACKAWGSNISTYGLGITWEFGIGKRGSISFGKKLFGGFSGASYYFMLPIGSNAMGLYSTALNANR